MDILISWLVSWSLVGIILLLGAPLDAKMKLHDWIVFGPLAWALMSIVGIVCYGMAALCNLWTNITRLYVHAQIMAAQIFS